MDNYAQYQSYVAPVQSTKLKRNIILGILLLVLLVVVYFLFNFRLVTIRANGGTSGPINLSAATSDGKTVNVGSVESGKTKTKIIRKGSYVLTATTKMEASLVRLDAGSFGTHSVDIKLEKQKNTSKIGTDGMGCSQLVKNTVYSFSCSAPGSIFRHTALSAENFSGIEPISDKKQSLTTKYRDGLLTLSLEIGEAEIYIPYFLNVTTGQSTPINVPADTAAETATEGQTITGILTDSNSGSSVFGLVLFDNSLLLYKDISDTQPTRIKSRPSETSITDKSLLVTTYSLTNGKLVVYAGRADVASDEEAEEKGYESYKRGVVDVLDISKPTTIEKTIFLEKDTLADSIYILENSMVLQGSTGVSVRTITGTSLSKEVFHSSAENFIVNTARKSVITGDESGIYEYSLASNVSNLVFRSDRTRFSSFSSADNSVIFNAFSKVNAGDSNSQIYNLELGNSADYNALVYKLPYSQTDLPIENMDFSGNLIVIKPILSSLEFIGLPAPEYDQEEYQTVTTEIRNQLFKDGITDGEFTIKFVI